MSAAFSLFLLGASHTEACPGSSAYIHAKCDMDVTFEDSCEAVKKEINGRVDGDNGWTDPHNGGKYTITNQTSSFISGQRVTGDGKYTDLFEFKFSPDGSGCLVDACSESQVTSVLDFSTNYCNLHSLYCSSQSGCPTVGEDLTYREKYSSCSQHDDVCVADN